MLVDGASPASPERLAQEPAAVAKNEEPEPAPLAVPPPLQRVDVATSVGSVEVGLLEPRGSGTAQTVALCIHGMAPRPEVVWEWAEMAPPLRERGAAVLCPNLHSCPRTAPAQASAEDVLAALRDLLRWARDRYGAVPVVVYGKSWGGARAVELAAAEGAALQGLALACPSSKFADLESKLLAVSCPVLLLWAQDDDVVPFQYHRVFLAHLKRRPAGKRRTLLEVLGAGGHRVAPFLEPGGRSRDKLLTWAELSGFLQAQTNCDSNVSEAQTSCATNGHEG